MIRWLSNPERLSRLLETILGGCLLAFLFFLANDVWFGVPQLDGKWNVQYDFRKSKLWQGMKCDFRVLVQQSNQDLKGTSEKISQTDREGKTYRYETAKRAQARFTGFVTKNYLRSDTISVH